MSNVSYNAANQLLTFGTESRVYNSLGQLTKLTAASGTQAVDLTYIYPAGTNSGKISQMKNAVSGEQVTYLYDSLNRLASAAAAGLSTTYGYDGFGNLTDKNNGGNAPSLHVTLDANNRLSGLNYRYDANGNMTWESGIGTYGYDAENRMTTASTDGGSLTYGYDSSNKRVWAWAAGAYDVNGNYSQYMVWFYGIDGKRLGAYQMNLSVNPLPYLSATQVSTEAYFAGRRVALMDRLGSAMATSSGAKQGFYPYGEDKGTPGANDAWKFGTYWRDGATRLDYADQRYYSNSLGRFMSPDPYKASGGPGNPKSWNRYAYVEGDPVNFNDPRGLMVSPSEGCGAPGTEYCIDDGSGGGGGGGGSNCGPGWATDSSLSDPCPVPVALPSGDGGGDGSGLLPKDDARKDLGKIKCYGLLGLASAEAAQKWFDTITFHVGSYGRLQVQGGRPQTDPAPANTLGYGQININSDYNWGDFSKVTISTGATHNYLSYMNTTLGTKMTSEQLGTMIIIHELRHNRGQDEESNKALMDVYNDCIK